METLISELFRQWGTFGLVVVITGFIIYDKVIKSFKKDNLVYHHFH